MTALDSIGRPVAFVTGSAYGIGAATAVGLARDGFDVAVSELRPDNLTETVKAVTAAGARAVPVELDVRGLGPGRLRSSRRGRRPRRQPERGVLPQPRDGSAPHRQRARRLHRQHRLDPRGGRDRAAVLAADPRRREFLMNRVPLKRFGITGQTLLVDGVLTSY